MKRWPLIVITGMALLISACTDTFLVTKSGHSAFLESDWKSKYEMLCETGALDDVLEDSHLDNEMKDALYKYSCSPSRSGEKVREIYASMTREQRKDIKSAFRRNGFVINERVC